MGDYVKLFTIQKFFAIHTTLKTVEEIQNLCINNNKELVVYISMGFGNPYGDEYHTDLVTEWTNKITNLGVKIISVADTVGLASPELISSVMKEVVASFKNIEVGVHLHSAPHNRIEKLDAALKAGVKRFDSAILGIGFLINGILALLFPNLSIYLWGISFGGYHIIYGVFYLFYNT